MEYRKCSKCREEKPLTDEYFYRRESGNFRSDCIICRKKYLEDYRIKNSEKLKSKNKEYRESNKEIIAERKKKYYQENKEYINNHNKENYEKFKEIYSVKGAEYRIKNKDKINARSAEYRKNNKEAIRERDKLYKQNNKDKIKSWGEVYYKSDKWKELHNAHCRTYSKTEKGRLTSQMSRQRRINREQNVKADFTKEQWKKCKEYFDNCCCYCGKQLKRLEQDHFIALSKGGEYTVTNMVPACKSCNSGKCDSDFFTWYVKQPFYSKDREEKILKYLNK